MTTSTVTSVTISKLSDSDFSVINNEQVVQKALSLENALQLACDALEFDANVDDREVMIVYRPKKEHKPQ